MTSRIVNRRRTGRRVGEEWYDCARCGFPYPRHQVAVQNGMILCRGANTTNCWDLPGHSANMTNLDIPREAPIEPLPSVTEEL